MDQSNQKKQNWKPYAINAAVAVVAFVIGGLWGYESGKREARLETVDDIVNKPFDAIRSGDNGRKAIAAFDLSLALSHARPENRDATQAYFAPLIDRLKN